MALTLDGTTGVSLVQDGVVTAADLASTLDLTGKTVTLPAGVGGKVLQVVNSAHTTDTSTTSTSYVTTGHSITITPSNSSSKVLVMLNGGGGYITGGSSLKLTIYRGGTDIAQAYNLMSNIYSDANTHFVNHSLCVLDSPATTSATTYTVYFKTNTGTIQYAWSDKGIPSLTAMEIAA